MNQNKMLVDYITMFHEQLDELYKLLQTDINYDKKFEEFIQEVVIEHLCWTFSIQFEQDRLYPCLHGRKKTSKYHNSQHNK